jgi:magnesium chelatase subunit D
MEFSEFVGHEEAKLSLILNAVDLRCGGVLFFGEKGSGKSTLVRLFKNLLPEEIPFIELPLNVTEDTLLGGIDIEATLKQGRRIIQKGILGRAHRGVVYIDDINLLSPEIISLIFEVKRRGENIIEREGFSLKEPSEFILIATMNPEEGALSPHILDNFGMCVLWEGLKEPSMKIEVLKRHLSGVSNLRNEEAISLDSNLKRQINSSRKRLKDMIIPSDTKEYIVQKCNENNIEGHRGEIFLLYGAIAYGAFCGDEVVSREHVDKVLPLVLTHRKRISKELEEKEEEWKENKRDRKEEGSKIDKESKKEMGESEFFNGGDNFSKESNLKAFKPAEEIFNIGDTFKIKRLIFRKDRLPRNISGRRTRTRTKGKSGRYIKSLIHPENKDIAIDATIRASAPFQNLRGRKEMILIEDEDLRFKQRERRMGHLVIFCVDGSGSMGVQRRMVETKGAIQSLLMDCYQKRDRVSMIVFREDRAEVLLPPTSSVELASRRLREIPAGGKTPLSAGLLESYKLIKNVSIKSPETRFLLILITDGRANHTMTQMSVIEELEKVLELLVKLPSTDIIVIDTEKKNNFLSTDFAQRIALKLGADYYTIENIKSEMLIEILQKKIPF